MKFKEQKPSVEEVVPLDPVLFAASVPAPKPTAKDLADCKERPTDAIEPKEYGTMKEMTDDL
ncbi:MAG: hypothetical protein HY043_18315 [Verrucomicrobia bacterium]|nr:hypothetical protein [Verrucomicrobiota bacterium]